MALPLVGRMLYQSAALFSAQLFSFIKMQDIYSLSKIKIFIADVREEIIKYLDGTQTLMNYKVACEVVFINQQFNGCLVQYQEVLGQWNEDAIKLIDYSLVKGRRQSEDAQKFSQHFFNFNEVFLKIFQSVLSLAENSPGIATRKLESIFIKIKIILNDFENKISSVAVNKNVSSLYSFKKINNYFQVNELTCNASFLVQARNINGDFKFQQIELAIIYFCDILSKYINSIKDSRRIKNESNVALSDISYELILAVQLNNELIQKREFFLKNALELSFSCSQSLFNGPRVSNMEYSSYLSDVIDFIKKLYFLEKDILFSAKAIIIFPGHYQHDKQRLIRIIKHHINILDLWQEKIPFKLWQGEWLFPSIRNNNFNQRPNNNWRQIDSSLDCQDFKGANEWNVSEGMAVLPGLTLTPSWPSQNLSSENVEIKVDAEEKSLYFEQQKAQKLLFHLALTTRGARNNCLDKFEIILKKCDIVLICRSPGELSYAKLIDNYLSGQLKLSQKDSVIFMSDMALLLNNKEDTDVLKVRQRLFYEKHQDSDNLKICDLFDKISQAKFKIIGLNKDPFLTFDCIWQWCVKNSKDITSDYQMKESCQRVVRKYFLEIIDELRDKMDRKISPFSVPNISQHIQKLCGVLRKEAIGLDILTNSQSVVTKTIDVAISSILRCSEYIKTRDEENAAMFENIITTYQMNPSAKIVVMVDSRHTLDFAGKKPGIFSDLFSFGQKENIKVSAIGVDLNVKEETISSRASGVKFGNIHDEEERIWSKNNVVNLLLEQ